jgi:transposase InsO family protein
MTSGARLYDLNDDGLLIRIASIDGSHQVVVPDSLTSRILYLEHYPPAVAPPRGTPDVTYHAPVTLLAAHGRGRMRDNPSARPLRAGTGLRRRKHLTSQTLPGKWPLESVAMDILGPRPQTKHGDCFPLVITDRFSKVTKKVPLRTVLALWVARAFCNHWAYAHGPLSSLLTDIGPQFTAKFFLAFSLELGIQKVFTTAYHPQANGQVERYNRKILASLRGYVAHRQEDWDDFTPTVTYDYNCRLHSSLGIPLFELALSWRPPTLSSQASSRPAEVSPRTLNR